MRRSEIMKVFLCCLAVVICSSGIAMGGIYISEDFSDGGQNWVDASENNFGYGPGQYISGLNIRRERIEAYYIPLGEILTQDDNFTARFDMKYLNASPSYNAMTLGFLQATGTGNWFDSTSATNVVGLDLYHGASYPDAQTSYKAKLADSEGTPHVSAYKYAPHTVFQSYQLDYTAGAGAAGVGQLELNVFAEGDYDGTPIWTLTTDMQAGETFTVDAFGMFTGHNTATGADGFTVYVDNVEIATPSLPGDANRDGIVSAGDYASVQGYFGDTGLPGLLGDANGDGVVSAADYASVQANYGSVAGGNIVTTPEPATGSLLIIGIAALMQRRKR